MKFPKKYPKSIIVNTVNIKVLFVKKIARDRKTMGMYSPHKRTIYIKKGLTEKERAQTFIHEMLHAIEDCYNIFIPHKLVYKLETPLLECISNVFGLTVRRK